VSLPAHFVMRLESFAGRVAWAGEAVQLVLVSVLLSSPPVPAYRWGQLVTVCVLVGGAGVAFGVGTCLVRRPSGLVRRTVWIGERGPETGTSGPSQTAGAGTGARGDDEEMAVFASPLRSGSSVATGASSAGIGAAESRTRSRPSTQTSSSSSTQSTSTRASRVLRASRTSEAEVEAEGPLRGADDDDDNVESDDDGMRSAAIVDPARAARTVITLTSESLGDADDGGYGAGLPSEGPVDGRRRPPTRLLTLTDADATISATIFTSSSGAFSSLNSSAFPSSASSSAWASTAAARRHRRIASAGRHQLDSAVTAEEEGGGEDDAWPTAAGTADIVVTGDDADNDPAAAVGARGRSTAAGRGAHPPPPPPPLPPRAPASAHIGGGGTRNAAEVEAATGGGELEELEEEEGEASLGFSAAAAAAAALEAEFEMEEEEEAEEDAAAYAAEISALHEHTNPLRAAMARSARRSVVGLGGGTLAMTRTSSSL
jgi:hypothetical protein